ncbi:unnamed protein product [Chrysoparadoxa australica]
MSYIFLIVLAMTSHLARGGGSTAIDFKQLLRMERAKASQKPLSSRSKELMKRRSPVDFGSFELEGGKGSIWLIPEYVSEDEAKLLEDEAQGGGEADWTNLYKRRLQVLGGYPHPDGMVPEAIPPYMAALTESLVQSGVFPEEKRPNHILLNEYRMGQGIAPHKDGPLYSPLVAILSLGSAVSLGFWSSFEAASEGKEPEISVPMPHRSLVIFSDKAYLDFWHGIIATEGDESEYRLSYTVRNVPRILPEDQVMETETFRQELKRRKHLFQFSVTEKLPPKPAEAES